MKYKIYGYFISFITTIVNLNIILNKFCLGTSCNRPHFYIQTVSKSIFRENRKAKLGDNVLAYPYSA